MAAALTAGGVTIAAADLWLLVICWKHRAVLAGVLGVVGISLVVFAIVSGLSRSAGQGALLIALITLVIGIGLYGLGQALERLLDKPPEEET